MHRYQSLPSSAIFITLASPYTLPHLSPTPLSQALSQLSSAIEAQAKARARARARAKATINASDRAQTRPVKQSKSHPQVESQNASAVDSYACTCVPLPYMYVCTK